MAVDITLWQMIQDTRAQKTEPKKDYISALWAEYKREKSDKVLGHMVGEIPSQAAAAEQSMRRLSLAESAVSRHGSFDSNTGTEDATKAPVAVPSPPAVPTGPEQPRRGSWWRRSSSSPKDMEKFVHMAFS